MAQDRAAHQMRFTICDPVEFPGRVLQPGTYYIRRDMPPLRVGKDAVIKVLDENQRHVLVTTVGIPAQRLEKGQETPFIFYEAPAGTPAPVRTWYLPGDVIGYDFVYPKAHLEQLAAALHAAPRRETRVRSAYRCTHLGRRARGAVEFGARRAALLGGRGSLGLGVGLGVGRWRGGRVRHRARSVI